MTDDLFGNGYDKDRFTAKVFYDLAETEKLVSANERKLAVHEAECAGRYNELKSALATMSDKLKWIIIFLVGFGTIDLLKLSEPAVVALLTALIK